MGLRIIYGRAGSGKTHFCFEEIKNKLVNKEKIYIITPEQFSFSAEKNLLNTIEENSVINAEVLTFDRMAYRVFQEVGGATEIPLSDASSSMMLYDILDKEKSKLTFLGKNSKNVEIISRLFTELKKHMIESTNLENAVKSMENVYLKKKLEDILILKKSFEDNIPKGYIEGADKLNKLADKLEESICFDNAIFYLDEFSGFTKQEYRIIEILLKKAKEVNVTVCTDCIEYSLNPEIDLFYENKKTALKLIDIANKNQIHINKSIYLEKTHRFRSKELAHLEGNIYRAKQNIYENNIQDIEIFLSLNPYAEIENLAKKIVFLVREKKYRYRDIAVITKNIDDYSSITKALFEEYNIPVFIDKKEDLSKNILIQYILSIFDIFSKNWSYESVFTYLKTGICNIDEDDIYILENYCVEWGIKGKKWYIDDWNFGNLDKEELEKINILRKKVVEPLIELKRNIETNKNVRLISSSLYYFLQKHNIFEYIYEKAKILRENGYVQIASEYETSVDIVVQLLDEIVDVFGDRKISFEKYREFLKIALENKSLGAIPGTQDQVIMGDIDRSRTHKVKAAFVLGLNDGVFPSESKSEGFLNDKDREYLKSINIELAKGTLEQLYDERFNIYKAFTISEEKLYLSYTSTDKEGKAIRPSVLIMNLKKILPKLVEKSNILEEDNSITIEKPLFDALLKNIYLAKQGKEVNENWYKTYMYFKKSIQWSERLEEALKGLNYTNLPEKIEKGQINKLYGNTLKTSVSKLEKYRSCPFSFHLKYGLKLKDNVSSGIKSIDTGNFMHDIIDTFFERIKEEDISLDKITKSELEELVSNIIEKKLKQSINYKLVSNSKILTLTRKLKKIILKSMEYIVFQLVNSKFDVLGTEIEFKNKGDYSPIVIELDDGKKVQITGKIDRVDLAIYEGKKYIRIIDYKSSVKKIDLNEVMYGLQIQLITYLNEMSKELEAESSGILYFNLTDYLINADKNLTEEELEKEIRKNYKMQGLILNDIKVVKMMDTRLENGYSETLPVYLGKEGISSRLSSTINKEDFDNLQKEMTSIIKKISSEILDGDISLKPYYNKNKKTPCKYCEYHSICNFNPKNNDNSYYYIPDLTKDEIIKRINRGEKNVQ